VKQDEDRHADVMRFGSASIKIGPMQRLEPSTRREFSAVVAFTMMGAGLRFWGYGGLGLNHFDEGIYALAGLWSMTPQGFAGLDPMVIPYAPPGFPFLVGVAYFVLGVADLSAILASTLCGIATIPLAAWVGRRTFGVGAGAATAALTALAMPHVAFSRKALTDVPFELAWLIAIGLGGRFLERTTPGRAIALGLGVGLAQQFKYNGWLTGVIVAVAAASGWLGHADERRTWLASGRIRFGPVLLSLVAVGVALLVYWPWFQFVEQHGGYRSLLAHHRSYVGGYSRWYPFWKQQQAQLVALSGGAAWGAFSWSMAWLGCAWSRNGAILISPWSRSAGTRGTAGFLGGAAALAVLPSLPWWLGIAAVPGLLAARRPALRMLGSWWLVLSILTPFYHPYARLWLPLHAAGWLLLAGLLDVLVPPGVPVHETRAPIQDEARPPERVRVLLLLIALVLGLAQQWCSTSRPFPFASVFQGTSALRDVVSELPRLIPPAPSGGPNMLVLGRRPLSFYLILQGRYAFGLVEGLNDVIRQPDVWAIVDGALLGEGTQPDLPPGSEGRVARIHQETLDPVTLLDISPGAATSEQARRTVSILVLKPAGAAREASQSRAEPPPLLHSP
jgi:dolichyl-phosphate-mannose-protein mannosyltransferase